MTAKEFRFIRQNLQKTQREMGALLGVSGRAVQSFEQGWRRIPAAVERQAFFLYGLKIQTTTKIKNCWEDQSCSPEKRRRCPAWELQAGGLCWFINGTLCRGNPLESWNQKMKICRRCKMFRKIFGLKDFHKLA